MAIERTSVSAASEKLNLPEETEVFVFPASFAQARLWFLDQLQTDNPLYNVSTALRLTGSLNITALQQAFNDLVRRHEVLRTSFIFVDSEPVQVIAPSLTIPLSVIDLRKEEVAEREIQIQQIATEESQRLFDLTTAPLLRVTLLQLEEAQHVLLLSLHHIVADGWSIGVLIRELSLLYKNAIYKDVTCKDVTCKDVTYKDVTYKDVTYKDVTYKDVTYKDVTYKDVTYKDVTYKDVTYKDVTYKDVTYKDVTCHVSTALKELPIQYADYAQWQRAWLTSGVLETQLAYWRHQLENIEVLNFPTDRVRPAVPSYKGEKQFLQLPQSLNQALEALSQFEGVTLFMTLLAGFKILLYRYTQQSNIVIGSPIANRNRSEIEGLIGFFVNSLVLRTDLSGNPTFQELLRRVREVTLGAYAHQDLPFEKLVDALHLNERSLSHHPLFQIAFSLQNTPIEALELPGLTFEVLEIENCSAKLDLEFHLWQDVEGLKVQVVYSTDLFDGATITRMLGHFQTLLESVVANPLSRLSDLQILTEVELLQIRSPLPPLIRGEEERGDKRCFHEIFEAQVEQTPDAIAVVFEDKQLTYRELNIRANQLAHYLQQLGVIPEVLVGICLERSLEMIVGVLGILKAGGAYLPLDPTIPTERLHYMLEDAQVSILLTHSSLAPLIKGGWGDQNSLTPIDATWGDQQSIIYINQNSNITQQPEINPTSNLTPDNLAYIIYTSGSTGKPKGVQIEHRGLTNLIHAQKSTFDLQPTARVLQFASLSFDASIFEIVMALATGGTLYVALKESLLPGQPLTQLLLRNAITHVTLPPAVLAVLPQTDLLALRTIICAGEPCTHDIVKRWKGGRCFFNAYGVTEATVWSTVVEITSVTDKLSIGRPIVNTQVYILDNHLHPVPIGVVGELYIGGDGLARGYVNRPELTESRFVLDSKGCPSYRRRLYKTGDLGRLKPDGNIEFLGRIDNQVKIRGFRIELEEIETVLSQHQDVQQSVVVVRENELGDKHLVAYIVKSQPSTVELDNLLKQTLKQTLKQKLPEYMAPSAFVVLDSLPLTPSGKIDYRALPVFHGTEVLSNFIAPRTETQLKLVKIWAEVLNIERVSINDNFFDLGGNSLLAVQLIERIHKQLEQNLPLSALFLNPTIETLASQLSSDDAPWSPLVAIQPHGENPPLFCVHPIFGVVLPYFELAYNLGKNQPFYGLQPVGIDGESTPLTRIEDMATRYIEALRTVQPNGPYFLAGWSFGGLVAFEMAQQLQSNGDEVAILALLDTPAPVSSNQPLIIESLKYITTVAARNIWSFLLDYLYLLVDTNNHTNNFVKRFARNILSHFIPGDTAIRQLISYESQSQILNELTIRPMLRIFQANTQAALNYIPKVYPNRITLFRTNPRSKGAVPNLNLGWETLTSDKVDTHIVSGNHLNMMKAPNIETLAQQLKACLLEKSRN